MRVKSFFGFVDVDLMSDILADIDRRREGGEDACGDCNAVDVPAGKVCMSFLGQKSCRKITPRKTTRMKTTSFQPSPGFNGGNYILELRDGKSRTQSLVRNVKSQDLILQVFHP